MLICSTDNHKENVMYLHYTQLTITIYAEFNTSHYQSFELQFLPTAWLG